MRPITSLLFVLPLACFAQSPDATNLPSPAQPISVAGTQLLCNANIVQARPFSAITLTSVPTIPPAGADGVRCTIINLSSTYSLTLQDSSGLAGSGLLLGGANVAIGANQSLVLIYSATLSAWVKENIGGSGLVGGPITFEQSNAGVTGTTLTQLAKIDSSGNAVNAGTGDTSIPVYIVTGGAGTTGSASLAVAGEAQCKFDGAGGTVAHFVVESTATGGRCMDAGATAPTSGWVFGQLTATVAANGTASVATFPGYNAAAGGSAVAGTLLSTAAAGVLTAGVDCATATPCNVRFTNKTVALTTSATGTLGSGTSSAGVYVYVDFTSNRLTLANSGAAVITCNANCDVVTGSSFPVDSVPLYLWPVTVAGTWDAFQASFDKRSNNSTAPAAAGSNLALTVSGGKQTISYDPTSGLTPTGPFDASGASLTKPNRTVSSDPSGSCPSNNEVALSTASGNLFSCLGGTWHSGSGGATDSSYHFHPTAASAINMTPGTTGMSPEWETDSPNLSETEAARANIITGITVSPLGGAHYAWLSVLVPVGWNGTIGLISSYYLQSSTSGTGTGVNDYAMSCFIPGTTNISSAITWTTAVTASFNITAAGVGAIDKPALTPPTCSPGTTASPTGAILLIRYVREIVGSGTATDSTVLASFSVSLPHTVQ